MTKLFCLSFIFQNSNKTEFLNLNDDSLLLILDQLNFTDLLSIAQTNEKLSRGAAYATRLKYSNHKFHVLSATMEPVEEHPFMDALSSALFQIGILGWGGPSIVEDDTWIYIKEQETIVKAFKYLGVYNLDFYSAYSTSAGMELMGMMISQYASDTLENVIFDGSAGVLKYITKPLVNVKSVTFSSVFRVNESDGILINTLFPAMQKLHLNVMDVPIEFIDHHMPNLEHLQTNFGVAFDITGVIEKNAQIQSFSALRITRENLKKVSLLLPNLRTLTLKEYDLGNAEEIHFENVTKFTVKSSNFSPENLHFPKLNDLHLQLSELAHLRIWANLLQRHPQVTTFSIDHFSYTVDEFDQLIGHLPNLEELNLWLSKDEIRNVNIMSTIQSNKFKESLEKQRMLRVFNLVAEGIKDGHRDYETYSVIIRENFEVLKTKMQDKWHIRNIPNGLSFERKYERPFA